MSSSTFTSTFTPTTITLIAAMDKNRAIGKNGRLPWKIPSEMKHFRDSTRDKPIIMGMKTFASLNYKPLPGRFNIVLSKNARTWLQARKNGEADSVHGVTVVDNLESALLFSQPYPETMVIGGAQIYSLFLPIADRQILSRIDTIVQDADTFYPDEAFDPEIWKDVSEVHVEAFTNSSEEYVPGYHIQTLERNVPLQCSNT